VKIISLFICFSYNIYCQGQDSLILYSIRFSDLNGSIKSNSIGKEEALAAMQNIIGPMRSFCLQTDFFKPVDEWYFPVQGYHKASIGGRNGSGYIRSRFNYLDGNRHSGHAAHDIFIDDRNQDCLEDKTGLPVNVLSVTSGVVVAVEFAWDTTSTMRGGKYVWIYDPVQHSLFYYAHNADVFVSVGQIVHAGETIATVGRSGKNAFKRRSPSHLHFSQLKFDKNYNPKPTNPYAQLKKAKFTSR
jgi:peptidoglycan LD-endopeptidase LytH